MFNLSKIIRKTPVLHRIAYNFCNSYVTSYVGFHSDIETNGEKNLLRLLAGIYADRNFTFVDGGANVGDWTKEVIGLFPHYQGHLFELMPATFEMLRKNLNNIPNLHLNNLGLSEKPETLQAMNFGAGHTCNTLVTELVNSRHREEVQQVQCTSLDQYAADRNMDFIDLLKLDIEGYELPAMSGAKALLQKNKIGVIQFEYSSGNLERKNIMRDFYDLLTASGYAVGPLRPNGVRFQAYHSELNCSRSGPNFIACLPSYVEALKEKA